MSENLVLLPAVDVADGQAVRLVQGEAGSETSYGDPLATRVRSVMSPLLVRSGDDQHRAPAGRRRVGSRTARDRSAS